MAAAFGFLTICISETMFPDQAGVVEKHGEASITDPHHQPRLPAPGETLSSELQRSQDIAHPVSSGPFLSILMCPFVTPQVHLGLPS